MLCGVSVVFNSLGDVLGLMCCKCNSEKGQVLIGFQSTEAFGCLHHAGGGPAQRHCGVSPSLHVATDARHGPNHVSGRSPSGSRTASLSLRVDTLISIRFMAQRPSQSSAVPPSNLMAVVTAHPRAMHSNLVTMEADLSIGPSPAVADAASATTMRRAGECCASSQSICS